ncbi:MAG: beta-L-arabinofuranosidase domain-containing protein [Treponemataceae bacterium]
MPDDYIHQKHLEEIPWHHAVIRKGFWQEIQQRTDKTTLQIEYEQLRRTGRLDSLKCEWKEGDPKRPHFFWDSDIAKWIEAASYSLGAGRNQDLENQVDEIVDLIDGAQASDGYFNIYFTVVEPGKRFTNLKEQHELYCLGHLIEAAIAYREATGKRKLLDIVSKYSDLVCACFGTESGRIRGYDGHPEIELALVKLFRATGNRKYLELATFFIDERGADPSFFIQECERRGVPEADQKHRADAQGTFAYYQAHCPIRKQPTVVGHAVRAMYLYTGIADLISENSDTSLYEACSRFWDDLVRHKLYITGGIGQNPKGERFTYEYDLPNDTAYNETCASIGLFFFAHKMMKLNPSGSYGDVMERCLYNTILGGASLNGDLFFYANPLSSNPLAFLNRSEESKHITLGRQAWFDVACCPPNYARLVLSLNGYLYLKEKDNLYVNLYVNSTLETRLDDIDIRLTQESKYPWESKIHFNVSLSRPTDFALHLRIPSWSDGYEIRVNGEKVENVRIEDGFFALRRHWSDGDSIDLLLPMRVRKIMARPEVAHDCGRVALERGPVVYCFEEADNGKNLHDLTLGDGNIEEHFDRQLLGEIVTLTMKGTRRTLKSWPTEDLYREKEDMREQVVLTAIPFYSRHNRTLGEMLTWIKSQD